MECKIHVALPESAIRALQLATHRNMSDIIGPLTGHWDHTRSDVFSFAKVLLCGQFPALASLAIACFINKKHYSGVEVQIGTRLLELLSASIDLLSILRNIMHRFYAIPDGKATLNFPNLIPSAKQAF